MSSNMKHTTGEWGIKNGTYPADIVDGEGKLIAMLCERDSGDDNTDEQDANAALIAAAPDLLEALTNLVNDWERVHGSIPVDHEARAAIISATK